MDGACDMFSSSSSQPRQAWVLGGQPSTKLQADAPLPMPASIGMGESVLSHLQGVY